MKDMRAWTAKSCCTHHADFSLVQGSLHVTECEFMTDFHLKNKIGA